MSKYNTYFKEKVALDYLSGKGSTHYLEEIYDINARIVWAWATKYKEQGINGFITSQGCRSYSSEFKTKCVELYISGEMYVSEIVSKYNISDDSVLRRWIESYNAIENLRIMILKGRSIWQKQGEKQLLKNVKKLLNIVLNIIMIIKVRQAFMMFLTTKFILDKKI
jgi:transposase-like protein